MQGPDLDAGLARLRDAAALATRPRDPAATERGGRRRRHARRAGATLAAAAAVVALALVAFPRQTAPAPPAAAPTTTQAGALADGQAETMSAPYAAQGGVGFILPDGWVVSARPTCPGRAGHPEAVLPRPGVAPVGPGCPPAAAPFALVELRQRAALPGAARRTVAGRAVLVRQGPAGPGPLPAPPGWTVTTALLPGPGGAVLLQVAEPGPGRPVFERVLAGLTG
jgi:hypothetical protein